MLETTNRIPQITRDDLRRIQLLRDSVMDLSVALDDLDAELEPHLAERTRLDAILRAAQAELSILLRKAA